MRRREILCLTGVTLGTGITGCIDAPFRGNGVDDSRDDTLDDRADDQDIDDMDDENSNENGIRDVHFEVIDVTGSDYELGATVRFGDDRVDITGTISGNNSCYTARMYEVDSDGETVTIDIESFDDAADDEVCLEVLVGISYEGIIEFDGDLPATAIVRHNREQVTERSRS